jgi:hypothetical protein
MKANGSLTEYESFFKKDYLKEIEDRVLVYLSDKSDVEKLVQRMKPEQFKAIRDEVILRFKDTNRDKFAVEEGVSLTLEFKNVKKVTVKVFEFNTETYYRKTMKPFDTSIDLQGMEPSFTLEETAMFEGVRPTKILTHKFDFDRLTGKIGTFIIEFMAGSLTSRAVVKKGSLTLIHKSSAAGHTCFLIDDKREICKGDKTGVWIENKFYKPRSDGKDSGAIFIPFAKEEKQVPIIMMHEGFAQLGYF